MSKCATCGEELLFSDGRHRCLPRWEVWDERYYREEMSITVRAPNPKRAVERWAFLADRHGGIRDYRTRGGYLFDIEDYGIDSGDVVTVCVMRHGGDTIHRYIVSGEMVPKYYARLVTQ